MIMQRAPEIDERGAGRDGDGADDQLTERRVPCAATAPEGACRPAARPRAAGQVRGRAPASCSVIWLVVGVIDAVVGLDFVFRLIAASDSGVAHVILMAGSSWLSGPFDGIFASVQGSRA